MPGGQRTPQPAPSRGITGIVLNDVAVLERVPCGPVDDFGRGYELVVGLANAVFQFVSEGVGAFFADEPVQRDFAAIRGAELDHDGVARPRGAGHGFRRLSHAAMRNPAASPASAAMPTPPAHAIQFTPPPI